MNLMQHFVNQADSKVATWGRRYIDRSRHTTKTCTVCRKTLPTTSFGLRSQSSVRSKTILRAECKDCTVKRAREYKARVKTGMHTCAYCGKTFGASKAPKYCSKTCALAAPRKKRSQKGNQV